MSLTIYAMTHPVSSDERRSIIREMEGGAHLAVVEKEHCKEIAIMLAKDERIMSYPALTDEQEEFYGHHITAFGENGKHEMGYYFYEIRRILSRNHPALDIINLGRVHDFKIRFSRSQSDRQYYISLVDERADSIGFSLSSANWFEFINNFNIMRTIVASHHGTAKISDVIDAYLKNTKFVKTQHAREVWERLMEVVKFAIAKGATKIGWQ